MQILRADSYPVSAWKNGGGETRQIAVFPPGADMDEFDWRLSMATVAQDGPFSIFDGIDRTLFVLSGQEIQLAFNDGQTETLCNGDALHSFPADEALDATLVAGPITDLNIMARRDSVQHIAMRMAISGGLTLDFPWETTAVFCASGTLSLSCAGTTETLGRYDCLLLHGETCSKPTITGDASLVVAGFNVVLN